MGIIEVFNTLSTGINAIAAVVIACLTRSLAKENRLLRKLSEDKPNLVVTKKGQISGTVIVTNLSRNPVAFHSIALSDCSKDYLDYWWNRRKYFVFQPLIIPSACFIEIPYNTNKPIKLVCPSSSNSVSMYSSFRLDLQKGIQAFSCISMIFSYSSINKTIMMINEFEETSAFPKRKRYLILD